MANLIKLNRDFWKDRKVLLTGHTGFKGSWTALWLNYLGAKVYGYSLPPSTTPSMYELCYVDNRVTDSCYNDILNEEALFNYIAIVKPSVIIHMAAQPLVGESYLHPVNTFNININGTLNILEVARMVPSIEIIEIITTDKCYKVTKNTVYAEGDPLGGRDPYSASKACAELVTESYRQSFLSNVPIITGRAGNVIGGGDWGKDRLITGALAAINSNQVLELRKANAIRPWQHILNVIYCYLKLIEESGKVGISGAWNIGPYNFNVTVAEFMDSFFAEYGKGSWKSGSEQFVETQILRLDNSKISRIVGWDFWFSLDKIVRLTVDWYKKFDESADMFDTTMEQIIDYNV